MFWKCSTHLSGSVNGLSTYLMTFVRPECRVQAPLVVSAPPVMDPFAHSPEVVDWTEVLHRIGTCISQLVTLLFYRANESPSISG